MYRCARQGDKETGRQGETIVTSSPCLPVSLSPCLRGLLICAAVLVTGCPHEVQPPTSAAAPRASVALRVLVVNEPGVAESINRLRGEWAERSGGEMSAAATTSKELLAAKNMDADAVIFPSRYMGEFCVRGWLRPVRQSLLESDEFNAPDVFMLVRELMKWGGQVMALPLGVDLYSDLHSPGVALLVRAAPAASSKNREGALFDTATMKPRISETPFVDALKARMATADTVAKGADVPAESDWNRRVPVLGMGDRMIAVTATSRNASSAFKLIGWLASAESSSQLARENKRLMPVRHSLAASADWFDPKTTATERRELGKSLEATLSRREFLLVPRIPGVDEYLSALDVVAGNSATGKQTPHEALQRAAERWEQITNSHGRDAQRSAYLKHLGISEN
jgi:hypothetical protein